MAKRILVAVTNDVSTDNRVDKTCAYLLEKGYEVVVYGRVLPDTLQVTKAYDIIRVKHVFNANFLFYAEFNARLLWFIVKGNFDVILSNDLDTLPACYFGSELKNTDLVYDSHELFSEGPELKGRHFVTWFWRALERHFLPKLKKAYTVSDSIAEFYHNAYGTTMGVVRNMPHLLERSANKSVAFPTENRVILYQGVLNPGRGLKPMIKALHYMPNIDLVIIGYGKVRRDLEMFVAAEKMTQRVHFLGRIDRDILPNYTKIATLGMVLEEPLGKSFEYALPNKLFDYIHAELPIIAGNLPEIREIIKTYHVGVCVNNYDPKTIATTVLQLLQSPERILEIKANQTLAKAQLCWEIEQKKLDNYFD